MILYNKDKVRKHQIGGSFLLDKLQDAYNSIINEDRYSAVPVSNMSPQGPVSFRGDYPGGFEEPSGQPIVVHKNPERTRISIPKRADQTVMVPTDRMTPQGPVSRRGDDAWMDPNAAAAPYTYQYRKEFVEQEPMVEGYTEEEKNAMLNRGTIPRPAGPAVLTPDGYMANLHTTRGDIKPPAVKEVEVEEEVIVPPKGGNEGENKSSEKPAGTKKEEEKAPDSSEFNTDRVDADLAMKIIQNAKYDKSMKAKMLDVARYQRKLKDEGFYGGQIDGIWGEKTDKAYLEREAIKKAKVKKIEQDAKMLETVAKGGPEPFTPADPRYEYTDKTGHKVAYSKGGILYKKFQGGGAMRPEGYLDQGYDLPQDDARATSMRRAENIRLLQKNIGVNPDGVWGPKSQQAYDNYLSKNPRGYGASLANDAGIVSREQSIRNLQKAVDAPVDGQFGPSTENAYQFSKRYGKPAYVKKIDSMYTAIPNRGVPIK